MELPRGLQFRERASGVAADVDETSRIADSNSRVPFAFSFALSLMAKSDSHAPMDISVTDKSACL